MLEIGFALSPCPLVTSSPNSFKFDTPGSIEKDGGCARWSFFVRWAIRRWAFLARGGTIESSWKERGRGGGRRGKRFTNLWQQQGVSYDLYRNINFFFSLFLFIFFFSSLHDGQKSPIPSMRSQSLSMPDASTTGVQYSRPRREKEGKRKHEKEAGERAAKRSYDGFRAAGGFFPPSFFPPRGSPFSHRSHRGSCTHLVAFQLLLSLLLL